MAIAALLGTAGLLAGQPQARGQSRAAPYRRTFDPTRTPTVLASSAILVDAVTGQVLYERNADVRRAPASTTKIMTSIMLLERCPLDARIMAGSHAEETDGSSLNLAKGEQVSARDLLYALLLRSANDACVALAEHVAGSEGKFAEMMTQRAKELGATNTQFVNSNGLPQEGHYTTARDLATLARYACTIPLFNEVVRTKYHTIARSSNNKDTFLKNHAKILWRFAGADGIKTGYTARAGHCFVGSATRKGWRLISVVLDSPDIVAETSALLQYGFDRFEVKQLAAPGAQLATVPIQTGDPGTVPGISGDGVRCVVPKGADMSHMAVRTHYRDLRAPVAARQPIGVIEVWDRDRLLSTAPLLAATSVGRLSPGAARPLSGGWYIAGLLIAAGIAYATASSKAPLVRGDRLASLLRGTHRGR